jgi:hypothetical protein
MVYEWLLKCDAKRDAIQMASSLKYTALAKYYNWLSIFLFIFSVSYIKSKVQQEMRNRYNVKLL